MVEKEEEFINVREKDELRCNYCMYTGQRYRSGVSPKERMTLEDFIMISTDLSYYQEPTIYRNKSNLSQVFLESPNMILSRNTFRSSVFSSKIIQFF